MLKIVFDIVWCTLSVAIVGTGAHLLMRKIEKRPAWTVEDSQYVARYISAVVIFVLAVVFYILVPLKLTSSIKIQLKDFDQIFGVSQKYPNFLETVYPVATYFIFMLNAVACGIVQYRFLSRMRYWRYISYLSHLLDSSNTKDAPPGKIVQVTRQFKEKALRRIEALRKLRTNRF